MTVAVDLEAVVSSVVDPEIPVMTIADLGILRGVSESDGVVKVFITPTYSGCPALRQIEDDIALALSGAGVDEFEISVSHNPPWTTDWISPEGHDKLRQFGIAPPTREVVCPKCQADRPRMVARFGSTACKALMVCTSCGEPFDYFKQF